MKEFYKVLIVDDEMLIRQGIINYIEWENEGYKIIGEASNGEEALEILDRDQPHILITDIVMPGMDGIELVKYVKEHFPSIEIIVLSSFEDFDYVKQTFQNGVADYILKPKLNTKDLLHTLHRITQEQTKTHRPQVNKYSIEDALKKTVEGYQSIREMEMIRNLFTFDTFMILEILFKKDYTNTWTTTRIKAVLSNITSDFICYQIPLHEDNLIILFNFSKDDLNKIKEKIQTISNQQPTSEHKSKWLISKTFDSVNDLKKIYETNHTTMQRYMFYLPNQVFLTFDTLPEGDKKIIQFDLNHMIYLFKRKQFQEAYQYVNQHIEILSNHYEKDVFEFKSWLENILFNIIVLLGNMDYDTSELDAYKYNYFSDINDAFHVQDAINTFQHFLKKVDEVLLPDISENVTNIQLILDYIENHYNENLTLQTLADHFHFNPSYLSSYFSKHHKEGFSEYLNTIRVKKAAEILIQSDLSISAISEEVGYSNPSYFTKVFKRIIKQSPSQYRKLNKQMN
ncbi:response regulator [Gracilibacillus marinus]|uniref:Response regulator n=1 Tax=Gracilibacillus marinus TaxID=630535 RepID=A0ABV8VY10_9BACI